MELYVKCECGWRAQDTEEQALSTRSNNTESTLTTSRLHVIRSSS